MRPVVAAGLSLALLALGACNKPAPASVDDAALDQVGQAVEAALNEPAASVVALLKAANGPISLDAMSVTLDQKTTPVDWWLWRRGFVQPLPAQVGGRPAFLLTDQGRALTTTEPAWFDTSVGDPKTTDCNTPAALEALGCEVEVEVTPKLTEAGRAAATNTTAALPPITVHALVSPTGDGGWQVTTLTTDGPSFHDIALNILLGPDQQRQALRQVALADLNVRQVAAVEASPGGGAGYVPPPLPPAEDVIVPVTPPPTIIPKRPGLR